MVRNCKLFAGKLRLYTCHADENLAVHEKKQKKEIKNAKSDENKM